MVEHQRDVGAAAETGGTNQAGRAEPWANAPKPSAPSPDSPTRTGGWQSEGVHVSSSWAREAPPPSTRHWVAKLVVTLLVVAAAIVGGWFTVHWVMGDSPDTSRSDDDAVGSPPESETVIVSEPLTDEQFLAQATECGVQTPPLTPLTFGEARFNPVIRGAANPQLSEGEAVVVGEQTAMVAERLGATLDPSSCDWTRFEFTMWTIYGWEQANLVWSVIDDPGFAIPRDEFVVPFDRSLQGSRAAVAAIEDPGLKAYAQGLIDRMAAAHQVITDEIASSGDKSANQQRYESAFYDWCAILTDYTTRLEGIVSLPSPIDPLVVSDIVGDDDLRCPTN
ncbi:MAG: hypothetical protein JJLCMIEE_00041 [Acidimicrobiales bacterium]|nr:hypothetical protein [Acidimicrobiales bacterium]